MVYKFLILSDEVDHFAREIEIDSEATFLELNDAILESVGYAKDQLTSFFICEDNWEKKIEVTLMDMETGYDEDSWVMGETRLSELLEDEKQRMLFVFDNMTERAFFIELREIITGKNLKKAVCTQFFHNNFVTEEKWRKPSKTMILASTRIFTGTMTTTRRNSIPKVSTIST